MGKVAKANHNKNSAKARKKRGHHCQWTEAAMKSALDAVRDHGMSQREACKTFNIPRCTLQVRLAGKTAEGSKPGRPTLLSYQQEKKLVDYACNRAALGIGFGRRQFIKYAGSLAAKHKVQFKHGRPSNKWWRGMRKRHENLKLRQPEGTAAVRHQCMDAQKVSKYFDVVKAVMDDCSVQCKPQNIWNMDETGVQLDYTPGKVVAGKGAKYLQSRTSGNRETITIICAVNAAGKSLPPHVIVKGQTKRSLNSLQVQDAPEGTTWSCSDSGWTKQGIALLWFKNSFLPNIGKERPQILVLDGHDSHNFLELIDAAIENNVHIIELPAHTLHWLQPCDRTLFGPFKNAYRKACDELCSSFPGSIVSKKTFCGLLKKAWEEAITSSNILSGFRACGIYPFNPSAIPQEAFIPNSLHVLEEGEKALESVNNVTASNVTASVGAVVDTGKELQSPLLKSSNVSLSYSGESSNTAEVAVPSGPTGSTADPPVISATPAFGLVLFESSLSTEQLECFNFCFGKGYDLANDESFMTWKQLKLLAAEDSPIVADVTPISEFLPDMSSEPLPPDAELSVTSDNVLPQLDLSLTDLLTHSLDHIEQSSAGQDTTVEANVPPEPLTSSNKNTVLDTDGTAEPLPTSVGWKKFPFSNCSDPEDSDVDVLPYPAPVTQKPKNRAKKKKYFVLTSKEARDSKLQEIQNKLHREAAKKAKAEASIRKNQDKL